MKTVSVATIVKNEEKHIEAFFNAINGMADELVLVDTGSTDATIPKVKGLLSDGRWGFTVRLMEKAFVPFHFGKAKNFAIRQCSKDYVFVLDADHRLSQTFKIKIKPFLETSPDMVRMLQQDDVGPHFIDPQIRLWKNRVGIEYEEDDVSRTDELLRRRGTVVDFSEPFQHLQGGVHKARRDRNWHNVIAMDIAKTPKRDSTLRELIRAPLAFYYIFKKIYISRQAWRDGWRGLRYALRRAYYKGLVQFYVALK